jgi:DNA-binding PadR family transcriptional regulator
VRRNEILTQRPPRNGKELRSQTTLTLTNITRFVIDDLPVRKDSSKEANYSLPLPPAVLQILVALADQDRHGYAIMQDVAARTDGQMKLSPGTLYGSIKRMLDEGLIVELDERPDPDHDDERRRYYRLTRFGREVAQAEADRLATLLRQARAVGLTPRRSTS